MDDFKSLLSKKRDDFDLFWEKTMTLNLEPETKRLRTARVGDIQTSYRRLFYEIIDEILQQLNYRFNGLNDFKFLELCSFLMHLKEKLFQKKHFNRSFFIMASSSTECYCDLN